MSYGHVVIRKTGIVALVVMMVILTAMAIWLIDTVFRSLSWI